MTTKSLYDEYKDRFCGRCKSYYNISICPDELFSGEHSAEIKACHAFIEKHFKDGRKKDALNFSFKNDYAVNERSAHMVSLYLLGLKLKVLFKDSIEKEFNNNITGDKSWYDFRYTWFLTCLYHDTASCVEAGNDNWTNNAGLLKSPYTTPIRYNDPLKSIAFRGSDDLAGKYFEYRKSSGKFDHGIAGGYLLFNRLIDSFQNATKDYDIEQGPMVKNGLKWRKEHIDHFRYIADAIICHNMWAVPSTDVAGVEKYKKYNLGKLIIDRNNILDQRLSKDNFPLQFMLCLLDTIEPVKRFAHLTAREVIENISIDGSCKQQIQIAWNNRIKQEPEFWKWMENIFNMKDWMQVDVSLCRQKGEWCYVTIDFR